MKIMRKIGLSFLALLVVLGIVYVALPKGPRDLMEFKDPRQVRRKSVVAEDLIAMGYHVEEVEDLHHQMGAVGAIIREAATGKLIGGADPRQENWAEGY